MSALPYHIKDARVVNEGQVFHADLLIRDGFIEKISFEKHLQTPENFICIDAEGLFLLPGVIDEHVHFREPGLTYKADVYTESKAAVAGGITSFMEMPNTNPPVLTQKLLEEKYRLASERSLANYSFYMGASNNNLDEVLKTDPEKVCGVKVFMGSSTGNMLVDSDNVLEAIFSQVHMLIATHCENDVIVQANNQKYYKELGMKATTAVHPLIRTEEACYLSSAKAVALAKKYGSRLHVLHLSTARELSLFEAGIPIEDKKITAEVCIHHLWFSDKDYIRKGNLMKWNPAVKTDADRKALREALLKGRIDVVATDHAPHTLEEKQRPYFKAPSGGPMVQHALVAMLELVHDGEIPLEQVVEKLCHNPSRLFRIRNRGFIRPGFAADLVLVDMNQPWQVDQSNVLYKCGWSPLEGETFHSRVIKTFVNGHLVYDRGDFDEEYKGHRLSFNPLHT